MKLATSIFLTTLVSGVVLAGCSVKEERGGCPCRLFLDMTAAQVPAMFPLSIYVSSGSSLEHEAVIDSGNVSDIYEVYVPRTDLDVVVWSGGSEWVTKDGLSVPLGYDCPPIFIHSSQVRAEGESVRDTVHMRKNHCVLNIRFMNAEVFASMTIRGGVAGFDWRGNPRPGEFKVYCKADTLSGSSTRVVLPRQTGDPLYLDVEGFDGKVKTFPLREYIAAAGYDWSEPDLKDLDLTLNYTLTSVSLVVSGWDEEFIFDVVI